MSVSRYFLVVSSMVFACALFAQKGPVYAPGVVAPSTEVKADAQTAVEAVNKLFILNTLAKVGDTGKPLPATGHWGAVMLKPESCKQEACFGVLYRLPELNVACTWLVGFSKTVLVGASGEVDFHLQPHIMDEDADAQRYTIKVARMPWERPTKPIKERNAALLYPAAARAAHIGGTVVIIAIVDEHGDVVETFAQSGPQALSGEVMSQVRQWHFEPGMVGVKSVVTRVPLVFNFSLYGNNAQAQIGMDGLVYAPGGPSVHEGTLTGNPDQRGPLVTPNDVLRQPPR